MKHEGEQGKLFVETLTCLDDRLSYCKTKILLRSIFSPAQTLHRRNTLKLVKPLRLPPVFQVQGSDLLCLVYMMNNLLQMDGVIDQTSLDLIARAMAIEQMKNMGEHSDALLLNLVNSYKQSKLMETSTTQWLIEHLTHWDTRLNILILRN